MLAMSMSDADHMRRALQLAERGRGRTSPNPMVGAVVVSPEGVVTGAGFHERAGEPHAEVYALDRAGSRAHGSTLYCTLEPCCHWGRTGPCVERIVAAGISRVVAAVEDPDPRVQGRGVTYLRARGIDVEVGLLREEAVRLNEAFFVRTKEQRPFVTLKAAVSLDGRIAAASGARTRLTSQAALRHAHQVRAEVDAIAVGSGTVLVDDPWLTVRDVYRERPLTRVIFDRRLRVAPKAHVFSTLGAGPVLILADRTSIENRAAHARALAARGVAIEALEDSTIPSALHRLGSLGIVSLLLEGGAELHAAAWTAGLVDRVHLYVAPRVLGDAGIPLMNGETFSVSGLDRLHVEPCGPDVFIEGYVHRTR